MSSKAFLALHFVVHAEGDKNSYVTSKTKGLSNQGSFLTSAQLKDLFGKWGSARLYFLESYRNCSNDGKVLGEGDSEAAPPSDKHLQSSILCISALFFVCFLFVYLSVC